TAARCSLLTFMSPLPARSTAGPAPCKKAIDGSDVHLPLEVLEGRDLGRLASKPELLPACANRVVHFLLQQAAARERLDVFVLLAGIDDALRAPWTDVRWVLARVEVGAPSLAQDVDRLRGA